MKQAFLFLFLILAVEASAQERSRHTVKNTANRNKSRSIVHAYLDSLRLASDQTLQPSDVPSDSYRLFAPMTFYPDITSQAFDLNLKVSPVSLSLLSIYLSRPDLVLRTQENTEVADDEGLNIGNPIRYRANLTGKVSSPTDAPATAAVEVMVQRPKFWVVKGEYTLQLLQNYISGNWYKGGESTYSLLGAVSMEANYNNRQKVKWDNKLELRLGLQNTRSDSIHRVISTEDLIRLTSKLGLQASKRWYYTLQLLGQTQFTHSYKSNDPVLYSDFMAPLKLNISLGMDYNVDWMDHHLKGTFHLAPIAYDYNYTRLLDLSERLGFDPGRHVRHDFGSQFTVDLTWELSDQLKWKTRMYGFTSFKRAEFEWENTFSFQLNRWLSAQLFVYPRFDDNVLRDEHQGYWQLMEFMSVGFHYSF